MVILSIFPTIESLENWSYEFQNHKKKPCCLFFFQFFWPAFVQGCRFAFPRDSGFDYEPNLQVQDVFTKKKCGAKKYPEKIPILVVVSLDSMTCIKRKKHLPQKLAMGGDLGIGEFLFPQKDERFEQNSDNVRWDKKTWNDGFAKDSLSDFTTNLRITNWKKHISSTKPLTFLLDFIDCSRFTLSLFLLRLFDFLSSARKGFVEVLPLQVV